MKTIIDGPLLEAHWREDVLVDGYTFGSQGTIQHDLKPHPGEQLDCSGGVIDNMTEALVSGPVPWLGITERPTAEEFRHMTVPRVGHMKRGDLVFLLEASGRAHHVGQAITDELIAEARSHYLPAGEQLQIHSLSYWQGRAGFDGPRYFPNVAFREAADPYYRVLSVLSPAGHALWTDANARAATVKATELGAKAGLTVFSHKTPDGKLTAWVAMLPFSHAHELAVWCGQRGLLFHAVANTPTMAGMPSQVATIAKGGKV